MNFHQAEIFNRERCKNLSPLGKTTFHSFEFGFDVNDYKWINYITSTEVINSDTLSEALRRKKEGSRVLLLNMANPVSPGGYSNVVGAQEEDLFRRTDLMVHLKEEMYPISGSKVILSRNVRVFSQGMREGYRSLPQMNVIDIISCAAVKNGGVGNRLSRCDAQLMKNKIETIFQVASREMYDTLVLSALGCGGFRCPPEHISLLFKKTIEKFDGCFKKVIFAIFDSNHPLCNYDVFRREFNT